MTLKPVLSWIKDGKRPPSTEGLPALVQSYWASWQQLQCDKLLQYVWEPDDGDSPNQSLLVVPQAIKFQVFDMLHDGDSPNQSLLVVPQALKFQVFDMLHQGCGGGHLGVAKTFRKIQRRFFWANMKQDVSQWCKKMF